MIKSKLDFLTDLLASKRLDSSMKQKFFELTSVELKNIQSCDYKIWEEINKLKAEFEKELKNRNNKNIQTVETIHNPIQTSECLTKFKFGNKLKWITHIYPNREGDVFDYKKITTNAYSEFKQIEKYLPYKLKALIKTFLTRRALFYMTFICNIFRFKKATCFFITILFPIVNPHS